MDRATAFFKRSHLVQGAQTLATIFCILGTIFIGLDMIGIGSVRPATFTWIGVGAALSAFAALASRRARSGAVPLLIGVSIGLLYLGVTWILAKAGG
jgi:protein-S-isoprenylcysteine O-methyltransferase Ste14